MAATARRLFVRSIWGFHVGDEAASVRDNRRALSAALDFDVEHLVSAQQTHGANARVVASNDRGRGALDWDSAFDATDALIVQQPTVPVLILVADCAPLLLVDARHHVLAVVHAGWRGAVAGIASRTLARMHDEFGSQPREVRVGIGPCLCLDCFEIGPDVAQAMTWGKEAVQNSEMRTGEATIDAAMEKSHLDLRLLLQLDLQRADVPVGNIEAMPHCPRCDTKTWFSHRGENGTTGRFGLVAWWE